MKSSKILARVGVVLILGGCTISTSFYQTSEEANKNHRTLPAVEKAPIEDKSLSLIDGNPPTPPPKPPVEHKPRPKVVDPQLRCMQFKMPKVGDLPPPPLDAVKDVMKSNMNDIQKQKALDEIEKEHIIALRDYGRKLKDAMSEAYIKHLQTCK